MRKAKVFSYRLPGLTVYHSAPISAKRGWEGRIWVKLPVHVLGTRMFQAAQQMIIQILRHNIKVAKVGRPTITFLNEILRRDPKAMEAYTKCRDTACKVGTPDKQSAAVGACSANIITNFMPKDLKP